MSSSITSNDNGAIEPAPTSIPQHVAVIMDGNGRWAKKRHMPRIVGHKAGVDAVRSIVKACSESGVEALTLFAFSSENWRRPQQEVSLLMELLLNSLKREVNRLHENNVRLCIIGDRSAFSEKLQQQITAVETLTAGNEGLQLAIAINYGGRWDITQASRQLASRVALGELEVDAIDEQMLGSCLALHGLPEPDLFIRSGGEQRISNFLLWQLAYTELYVTDTLWPDFDRQAFDLALTFFASRQRRFGRTGDQLDGSAHA